MSQTLKQQFDRRGDQRKRDPTRTARSLTSQQVAIISEPGSSVSCVFLCETFQTGYLFDAADFQENYGATPCKGETLANATSPLRNETVTAYLLRQGNGTDEMAECNRASSLLFLLLMFGTVWVGVSLYNFNKT